MTHGEWDYDTPTDPTPDIATLLARALLEAPLWQLDAGEYSGDYADAILATPSGKAILDRLARAEARTAELERALDEELATRDEYHEVADNLSLAIAPMDVIGEHTSGNDPWTNAIEEASFLLDRLARAEAALDREPWVRVHYTGPPPCFWCRGHYPKHDADCKWLAARPAR